MRFPAPRVTFFRTHVVVTLPHVGRSLAHASGTAPLVAWRGAELGCPRAPMVWRAPHVLCRVTRVACARGLVEWARAAMRQRRTSVAGARAHVSYPRAHGSEPTSSVACSVLMRPVARRTSASRRLRWHARPPTSRGATNQLPDLTLTPRVVALRSPRGELMSPATQPPSHDRPLTSGNRRLQCAVLHSMDAVARSMDAVVRSMDAVLASLNTVHGSMTDCSHSEGASLGSVSGDHRLATANQCIEAVARHSQSHDLGFECANHTNVSSNRRLVDASRRDESLNATSRPAATTRCVRMTPSNPRTIAQWLLTRSR